MDTKASGWIDLIINSFVGWINKGFEFFGLYTSKYSKVILILIGMFLVTKMFNAKVHIGGGGRR